MGLQDRRTRKILANMCEAGLLMKVGATSNLKYILKNNYTIRKITHMVEYFILAVLGIILGVLACILISEIIKRLSS